MTNQSLNKLQEPVQETARPSVSVLLPIRNEAAFIDALLAQLLNQDYPSEKMEILVADGMSDDGTRRILEKFSNKFNRIKWFDNPERIVAAGLNKMILIAQGDVLMRLDGHTFIPDDYVRTCVDLLMANPDAWGVGGPIIHKGKSVFGQAVAIAMSHPCGVGNATHRFADFEGYAEGAAFWTFHRWVFNRVGHFDESLVRTEDDEFNYRITRAGGKIYLSPKIRSEYFVRETMSKLAKQYYQYSFWRIPVIRKHRRPTTLRQLIPSLFYGLMLALFFAGLFSQNWLIAVGLPLTYLQILILIGLSQARRVPLPVAASVPVAMVTMHAAYAAGMWFGWMATVFYPTVFSNAGRMASLSR